MGAVIGNGEALHNSVDLQATHAVEYHQMDEATKQLVDALEHSVQLQLKPIEDRQEEILSEVKQIRQRHQALETQAALSKDRISRYESDLTKGLSAIRKSVDAKVAGLEKQLKDRNRLLTPMFAALASITVVLVGLFVRWLLMGGPS